MIDHRFIPFAHRLSVAVLVIGSFLLCAAAIGSAQAHRAFQILSARRAYVALEIATDVYGRFKNDSIVQAAYAASLWNNGKKDEARPLAGSPADPAHASRLGPGRWPTPPRGRGDPHR